MPLRSLGGAQEEVSLLKSTGVKERYSGWVLGESAARALREGGNSYRSSAGRVAEGLQS